MPRKLFQYFFTIFLLLLFSSMAVAEEKISRFDVTATFEADGSMLVSEAITVQAGGESIKRGIIRYLPLAWSRPDARNYRLHYTVRGVLRDGQPEPYSLSNNGDMLSIRIGSSDYMLPPGCYTYTIIYEIRNHFSRFDGWDELYWNVTGNGWDFPMDSASFRLFLPGAEGKPADGPFRSVEFYTGYAGELAQNAESSGNSVYTTSPLRRHQGLTVVYTWDRSILALAPEPEEYRKLYRAVVPSASTLPLFAGPFCMLLFFAWQWRRLRPEGKMPVVVPLFEPPAGLMPGELRYVLKKYYDSDAFAADLLNMVSRGKLLLGKAKGRQAVLMRPGEGRWPEYLDTREKDGNFLLVERHTIKLLFASGSAALTLGRSRQEDVRKAREYLEARAVKQRQALFTSCASATVKGSLFLLLTPFIGAMLFPAMEIIGATFGILFFVPFIGFLVFFTRRLLVGMSGFAGLLARLPLLIFTVPFWYAVGILLVFMLPELLLQPDLPEGFTSALGLCAVMPFGFYLLAPRRTALGLQRLAMAKGLILYMATAEEKRYEALYPPLDNVERFERLLPFALALGIGKTWAGAFSRYLDKTGAEPQNFKDFSWSGVSSFRGHASSSSASRSASSGGSGSGSSGSRGSGSGGGGSSGGGSGGGGGSGW